MACFTASLTYGVGGGKEFDGAIGVKSEKFEYAGYIQGVP